MKNSNTSLELLRSCFPAALLIALFLLPVDSAFAVDPNRLLSQYIRNRWGPENGFPRGPVYSITQTPDGYLWFGVEDGLLRFDGTTFLPVRDETRSFTVTSVIGLTPDNEGNLWLRMADSNLLRYRDGVFDRPSLFGRASPSGITAMSRTNHGDLLVSHLLRGAVAFLGGKFEVLASIGDLPRTPILATAQTSDGAVWLGTRDAGVFRLRAGASDPIAKGLPDPKIDCLLPGLNRELWIGTDRGIVKWDGEKLVSAGIPDSQNQFQALAMVRDRDGNLWVGTDSRGLLRLSAQGAASFDDPQLGEAVTAVFEDREGNLWIGRTSGVERLRDSAFVTYSSSEGIPSDGSLPLFVDSENRIWFPPVDGGLWWLKDGRHGQIMQGGLDHDVAYSITGAKGELWLGRKRGGLTQIRTDGRSPAARTYTQRDGLAQNSVFAVYRTRDGTVWAGTLSGGVSRLQNGTFTTYTSVDGLGSNTVFSILEGADGTMWFGTPTGLSSFSKGKWQTYRMSDGLPSDNVNCIYEDSQGTLWAGTAAGLAYRSANRFRVPMDIPAALREQILGIAEDEIQSIWLATANHVMRAKRRALLHGAPVEGDFTEYGLTDGLRGVEGVRRHRSVVTDPRGRIWFSMNRGLSVVDPTRVARAVAPVIVHVQAIAVDGKAMNPVGTLRLPALPQRVTIAYAGLSLSVPERVRFRYRLDGFDHAWSAPVAAHETVYTNLGPGHYRFRVIASSPYSNWSGPEAVIPFDIEPAFWQTWWFQLYGALACALTILGIYRLRLHQMKRQLSLRFEERLAERTRIAQELHDTLLQGFLSASMQLHVAVDNLPEQSPARPSFSRILLLIGRVIEEGRNAVRGLRTSPSATLDLEQAFSRIPHEFDDQNDVAFRVTVEGRTRPLHPVLRDEAYRIGREALVNAFRHARATAINVEIEYGSKKLRLLVSDNGCGIDPKVIQLGREGHWGLPGMRERAERIGARLHVWSNLMGGTEVELSVPGHIAYQDQSRNALLRRLSALRPATNSTRREKQQEVTRMEPGDS